MNSFGVVGCGKMGQALVSGMKDVLDVPIVCCDVSDTALNAMRGFLGEKASYTHEIADVADRCDVVLLAVKPVNAPDALTRLGNGIPKCILSIVAGIKHDALRAYAGRCEVVRIMPNTPVAVSWKPWRI